MIKKKSKYRNQKTDGFSSKKEAKRAAELRVLLAAGEIADLRFQQKYELIPRQYDFGTMKLLEREVSYISDFEYFDQRIGAKIVEDVKGVRTPEYKIKRKLMLKIHGIRIKEI